MPAIHVLGNLILIIAAAAVGYRLSRRKRTARLGIALSSVGCLLAVVFAVRPDLILRVVTFRDLAFYANLYPATVALFVPCAFHFVKTRNQRRRMAVMCALLLVMSFKPFTDHFRAQAHSPTTMIDKDGICRQSSDYTCSAASLVTYLSLFEVSLTEADAIEMARTKARHGTTSLGLYRALCINAPRVGDRTPTVQHLPVQTFLDRNTPAIIQVGLPQYGQTATAAAFGRDNNWPIGIYHDVVFMGIDPDDPTRVVIADPDMGIERWPIDHFQFLFRGTAVGYQ